MLSSPRFGPPNLRLSFVVCNCRLAFISLRLVANAAQSRKHSFSSVNGDAVRCVGVEVCRIEVSTSLSDAIATLQLKKPSLLAQGPLAASCAIALSLDKVFETGLVDVRRMNC